MEIRLQLDDDLVAELDEEAQLQGFDDRGAYLRWIVANRPMSDLASTQAPAVASRVSELEERVKLLERQLDLDEPTNPDADLGEPGGAGTATPSADSGGAELEPSGTDPELGGRSDTDGSGDDPASLDDDIEPEQEAMDLEEGETEEEAAADDDIAEAIGDVSLDDDEAE